MAEISGEKDLVIASTKYGQLIAYDLEGAELWREEDGDGYPALSDDGSTVVDDRDGEIERSTLTVARSSGVLRQS